MSRQRPLMAATAAVLLLVGLRVGAAPAERCPPLDATDARVAAEAAVGWLAATQAADGSFLYLSDERGRHLGGYNATRHAGVLMSLQQAVAAGIGAAEPVADRGARWALDHLEAAGGGRALAELDGSIRTGASALLVRALLPRPDTDPELLEDLGTFLAGQVDEAGAVLAAWDPAAGPTGEPNPFFTGEAYWALLGLDGHEEATARIGAYLPVRDEAEERFPPLSDHWAAYSYAAIGATDLTDAQWAHADRMAELFGVQVRGEATRWRGGLQATLRGGPAGGSGLGTLGEGSGNLLRLYGAEAPSGLEERLRCVAGMLVARQAADGAWYTHGVTRMDDQQHALSALLLSADVLTTSAGDAVGGGEERHPLLWLAVLGLAAGVVLAAAGRVRDEDRAAPDGPAGAGPLGAAVIAAVLLVVLAGPVLDALDLSPASVRAAAGIAAAVAALGVLAAPRASATAGLVAAPSSAPTARARVAAAAALLVLGVDLVVDGILGV